MSPDPTDLVAMAIEADPRLSPENRRHVLTIVETLRYPDGGGGAGEQGPAPDDNAIPPALLSDTDRIMLAEAEAAFLREVAAQAVEALERLRGGS